MKAALTLLALAACGDNNAAPLDAAADASTACTATFSGNFTETSASPANCAHVHLEAGATTLAWYVTAQAIDTPFDIWIALGHAPAPGTYTAQSLPDAWDATALQQLDMTSCLYHAGTAAVPPGTFALQLTDVDATRAHGTLDVALYVLARPFTYCGDANTEHVSIAF